MSLDARKNFALSTVLTAPSPATSGTSIVLASGGGAKFPAAPFNIVVWPTGANPTDANAEIMRVTAKSTDTLTVTRTQEGTSARTVIVGDQVMQAPTDRTFKDIEEYLTGVSAPTLLTPVVKTSWDGWIDVTADSWSYSSWTSGTRIGEITVPTDATTRYQPGHRIKITQSTGGTKYGIIVKVTSTVLTVFFPSGTTLNNEAISSPYYSNVKAPFGMTQDPEAWSLSMTSTSTSSGSASWSSPGTLSLAVGIGAWIIRGIATIQVQRSGNSPQGGAALSDSSSAVGSGYETTVGLVQGGSQSTNSLATGTITIATTKTFSSATTLYLICILLGGNSVQWFTAGGLNHGIKVTSGYL